MKKIYFLTLLALVTSGSLFADNDSLKNNTENKLNQEYAQWLNELDSLVYSNYYFRKDTLEIGELSKDELTLELPDSVYKERIRKLYSPLTLSYNQKVRNRIDFYIKKAYRQIPHLLALSKYYFPMFEETLDQYGLPYELKYLPVIESALNPEAVSYMGAAGLWQFMYRTGKHIGLEIDSYVDERLDPLKSTHAACKYLTELYNIYDDWMLVIAAYNCGPGTVNRALRRAGKKSNFWEIYYYLPRETRGYVPAFIAVNYIYNYYDKHGFKARNMEVPQATDTVMVKHDLHFGQISEMLSIDMETIKFLNPGYKRNMIPADSKARHLILPADRISDFIDVEDTIHLYKDSLYLNPQKIAYKPKSSSSSNSVSAKQPEGTKALYYNIKSGDALGLIASWYDVGTRELKRWNGLYSSRIRAGKKLVVYVPDDKVEYYKPINSMSRAEKQKREGVVEKESSKKSGQSKKLFGRYKYYTVRSGDNPWIIAKKYPGISASDIMELNNIDNPSGLKVGEKIKIHKES